MADKIWKSCSFYLGIFWVIDFKSDSDFSCSDIRVKNNILISSLLHLHQRQEIKNRRLMRKRPQKPLSNSFYEKVSKFFTICPLCWICHFEISNLTPDSLSQTTTTSRYQVSWKSTNFLKTCPPYWIRHPEFCKSGFGFVISDPKNPRVASFIKV